MYYAQRKSIKNDEVSFNNRTIEQGQLKVESFNHVPEPEPNTEE